MRIEGLRWSNNSNKIKITLRNNKIITGSKVIIEEVEGIIIVGNIRDEGGTVVVEVTTDNEYNNISLI